MSRPSLVFATRRPPWPLDNGARIRAARLAQGLAEVFDLTLVTFADGPAYDDTHASREELAALLPAARLELVRFGRPHPGGARREAWRRRSVSWGAYATPTMRAALVRLLAGRPGAMLHLDDPGMGLAGLGLAPRRTAFAPHNVEHRIVRQIARERGPAHRPFLEVEWRKIAAEERRLWRGADLCVAVSDVDAATMREGGAQNVALAPNGSDLHEPLPPSPRLDGEPLRLLFVGSGAFWPYERGLAWFATEVMPRLRAQAPVVFDVVGERPPAPVAGAGIAYHGRVPEVEPFYRRAHALVVPVFEGSGTRLKVVEASLLGRPVISTALGAEGLPVRPGEHYARAETAEEWVAAVDRLRRGELAGMASAARSQLADFTWPRIAAALAQTYRQLVGAR
jgi:glycosyltransferase involved in cell wall biosynthesis